jgi:WD40 repeat protein
MNQGYGLWRHLGISQPTSAVRCITNHPTCHWVATGLASGELTVLDDRSGVIRSQWRAHETSVTQVMPIGEQQLLSSGSDRSICIWDIGGMEPGIIQRFSGFDENAKSIISHYPGEITCGIGSRIAFGELSSIAPLEKRYGSRLTIVPLKSHKSRSPIAAISVLQSYKLLLLGTEDGRLLLST